MVWSSQEKRQLVKCVNELQLTEHVEIFKIINKNETMYSKNNNGVFINISTISDEMLEEINSFIIFCLKNKEELDAYEKKMQECKTIINTEEECCNNIVKSEDKYKIDYNEDNSIICPHESLIEMGGQIKVKLDSDKIEESNKVVNYINYLNDHVENINKKKNNMKYVNAKKKFSRKIKMDRKGDLLDLINDLDYEDYLIV
jgi:hypothetical protein